MTRPLPEQSVGEAVMAALEAWDWFCADSEAFSRLEKTMEDLREAAARAVTKDAQ